MHPLAQGAHRSVLLAFPPTALGRGQLPVRTGEHRWGLWLQSQSPAPGRQEADVQASTPSGRDQRAISLSLQTSHKGGWREDGRKEEGSFPGQGVLAMLSQGTDDPLASRLGLMRVPRSWWP